MKNLFTTFVAVAVLFVFSALVQAQEDLPEVVPAPAPPTTEQTKLAEADAALAAAKEALATVNSLYAEAIASYRNQEKDYLRKQKTRIDAEKPHNLFESINILPKPYEPNTTTLVKPARLESAERELTAAQNAMTYTPAGATDPVTLSISKSDPTLEEVKLIKAFSNALAKWHSARYEAQNLRMLVKKGPTDPKATDVYAEFRYRLEAPDNWTPEMIIAKVYEVALEKEEESAAKLAELKPAYHVGIAAIKEAEAAVKAAEETRNSISTNVQLEDIGKGVKEIRGEISGVKSSIDALAANFDKLTKAITSRQIANKEEALAIATLYNRIEELRLANNLNAKIILDLQRAQTFVTYAQPGQAGYTVSCNRSGRRCWSVAN